MESGDGSREPQARFTAEEIREAMGRIRESNQGVFDRLAEGPRTGLTDEERQAIADGEPYCFRCGKPASSFREYRIMAADGFGNEDAATYVREDEGTYNPETNRFACDECYIAIGMPSTNTIEGWKAP